MEYTWPMKTKVNLAVFYAGGQSALALKIGVSRQATNRWDRSGNIPPERIIDVCRAGGWQVVPHEIRPDIYPNPGDGLPPG